MTSLAQLDGPSVGPASGGAPKQIVLLLHGYGSNGADLISFAPYWQPMLPDALFVAPNAPEELPGSWGGYQWWGLTSLTREAMAEGIAGAAPILNGFIDEQLARHGLTEREMVLVGFSQGTMMALQVGPCRATPLAGILGYSGMLADPETLAREVRTRPPVLLVHGSADPMVPVASMTAAKSELEKLGFAVSSHVSPGLAHSIDQAGLQLGGEFVRRVLG
jgi:phospholipase/carboxylesterase